jgi:hypothetical protein
MQNLEITVSHAAPEGDTASSVLYPAIDVFRIKYFFLTKSHVRVCSSPILEHAKFYFVSKKQEFDKGRVSLSL